VAPELTVQMLGDLRVRRSDGSVVVDWTRPPAAHLLCLLLTSPHRSATRQRLAATLFGGQPPDRQANSLAKAVTWCRAALGQDAHHLVTRSGRLEWDGPATVDIDDIAAAATQLDADVDGMRAFADGDHDVLTGWTGDWVDELRDRVTGYRRAIALALARRLSAAVEPEARRERVRRWHDLAAADPLDESAREGLIRALLARGSVDEALCEYVDLRARLWLDLAVEPSPVLDAALRSVRGSGSPFGRRAGLDVEVADNSGPVGRDNDVAQVLARTIDRATGAAVITGSAGIGKTAVLEAVVEQWRRWGWQVVRVAGRAESRPFGSVSGPLAELLAGSVAADELRRRLGTGQLNLGRVSAPYSERSESGIHEAVLGLLDEAAAGVPLLVAVDDLDAADPATVRLLHVLAAAHGRTGAWSIVATSRDAAATSLSSPGFSIATLKPLPIAALTEIIRRRQPKLDEEHRDLAVRRAAGVPLYAVELADLYWRNPTAEISTAVPPSVVRLVRERLQAAGTTDRLLVFVVAIGGQRAVWQLVARVAGALQPDAVRSVPAGSIAAGSIAAGSVAAGAALDPGLLTDRDGVLEPAHPLLREAALAMLSRGQCARLHEEWADALEEVWPSEADDHRVAAFGAVPDPRQALPALSSAVRLASAALFTGDATAAAHLGAQAEQAWAALDHDARERHRDQLLHARLVMGHALSHSSPAEVGAAYDNGWSASASDDDRALFAHARGWLYYSHGYRTRAVGQYRRGLELSDVSPIPRARLGIEIAWCMARDGRFAEAVTEFDRWREFLTDAGVNDSQVWATLLDRLAMSQVFRGELAEGQHSIIRAAELAADADDPGLIATVAVHRGEIAARAQDFPLAHRHLDEAIALAHDAGETYVESVAWWMLTDTYSREGDLDGALAANTREHQLLSGLGNQVHLAACRRRRRALLDRRHPVAADGQTP
jgi:DNA-binding SARP family transcriptional activator/tetratricopeptide (TPR) repeat protein